MKKKHVHFMFSERRLNKLQFLAVENEKTMTQILEELIDTLPEPKRDKITQP